jgi:crotonobetainyl-CoA:carnitine CoA-transferase CaiB-like acyl-CoA transferase
MTTGKGRVVQVSLMDAALASLANQATNWLVAGHDPQPMGSEHPNIVPYGTTFETRKGKPIVLAIGNDAQFQVLTRILGLEAPAEFLTNAGRVAHRAEVRAWLVPAFAQWDRTTLLEALERVGVPAGAIHTVAEAFELPEADRLILMEAGIRSVRSFVGNLSHTHPLLPPPLPGQHQDQIVAEFG